MKLITTMLLIVGVTRVVSNAVLVENADDVGGSLQSPHIAGDSTLTQDWSQPIVFRMVLQKDGKVLKTCMGTEILLISNQVVWVTAAECLDATKYDNFRLETMYFSRFKSETFNMNKVSIPYVIHPKYNNATKENNIAVIKALRYLHDHKRKISVLAKENDLFVNKEVDIFLEWKNVTESSDAIEFELNSIPTKIIKPIWCKLWYPFSPNKANNVCASGWYGKGLSKGIIGSPIIDTETQEYKLIGIATQNRRWTRWFGLPIEFLSIEPYIEWLQTIVFDQQ